MTAAVKVDVWSDVACPWCFIGKRRLERAVAGFDGAVEVEFHSFELSPDTPVDFEGSVLDFLATRKGIPVEQAREMQAHVAGLAAAEGLAFDFGAVQHTRTLRAHQVLHLAKERGLQAETKERLLSAYFEQGRHIGHVDELAALGADVGLDAGEVVEALESERYLPAVEADVAQARSYGITGVPFFVFAGRLGVSGAQDPAVLGQALERASRETVA